MFIKLTTVEVHLSKAKKIRNQVLPPSPHLEFLPLTFCQPLDESRIQVAHWSQVEHRHFLGGEEDRVLV